MSVDLDDCWLIFGLGYYQVGSQDYESLQKDDAGAMVVRELARRAGVTLKVAPGLRAVTANTRFDLDGTPGSPVLLALCMTGTDDFGPVAARLAATRQIQPARVIVIHSDVSAQLGTVRVKFGGGVGGYAYRWMTAINAHLGSRAMHRVDIGVGQLATEAGPHSGRLFRPEEVRAMREVVQRAAEACQIVVADGAAAAQRWLAEQPALSADPSEPEPCSIADEPDPSPIPASGDTERRWATASGESDVAVGWLDRYRRGDPGIWHELRQYGSTLVDPELAQEAQLVCDEMARRARRVIEGIDELLVGQGYEFSGPDDGETWDSGLIPPGSDVTELLDWLRKNVGPVPMTLSSWLRLVGDVCFMGEHPRWSMAFADPLVFRPEDSIRYLRSCYEEYSPEDRDPTDPPLLGLVPGLETKSAPGGDRDYGLVVPDGCVDGIMHCDGFNMLFVDYLNWMFRSGGFPRPKQKEEREIRSSLGGWQRL